MWKWSWVVIWACVLCIPQANAYQDKFEIHVKEHPKPRAGEPHIHWCTMCGADNRYAMLKETIEIIAPYFDEIHIVDNGSTDETPTLVNLSPKVTYTKVENWEGNWAKCYFASIKHVCKNEWFMFHDSDERPSPEFLKNLRMITRWADQQKANVLASRSCHHSYDKEGKCTSNYDSVISELGHQKLNFVKRQNMKIKAFGGHTGFHLDRPKLKKLRKLNPQFFYNHYKSEDSMRVSLFTHGFLYPTTFDGLRPYAEEIIKIRDTLGVQKIEQLFAMLYKKDIPEPIVTLVKGWETSNPEAREVWELIVRDNCDFSLPTHCNRPCCAY